LLKIFQRENCTVLFVPLHLTPHGTSLDVIVGYRHVVLELRLLAHSCSFDKCLNSFKTTSCE